MRTLLLSLLTFIILFSHAHAILTIEITGGTEEGGQPIAIIPFALQGDTSTPPQDITKIISDDLYRSGRFAIMPVENLPEKPSEFQQIDFSRWQAAGMPYLVVGRITGNAARGYTIDFELFDVVKKQAMIGFRYTANRQKLRKIAHQISDEIYKALTGERGVFSTRIVYVSLQRSGKQTRYQLYVADADGANPRQMLKSTSEPIFSPSWSPDGQRIAYVTYASSGKRKQMVVYIQEVSTGKRTRLPAKPGLNTAPAWSPDGKRLALTLSKDGNAEIYIMNLQNRALTRLTTHSAIDTEPEWSPDGKHIVFTSDRGGKPQIYRIPVKGGKAQRLTFQGSYNARPRFSPDGRKLALLHNGGNGYRIAVLNLENRQLKVLTETTLDESPSFAPNGGMILYTTGPAMAAVSTDGRVRQRLAEELGGEVREPAWSPFFF